MDDLKYERLKLKYQLCFPLYAASKEVVRKYRPYLDALELTYTQYIVMMVLWEEKKLSVKALGEKLYLDSGTLTPVLKSLEKKGYLTRERSKNDERVLDVSITERGERLKERALSVPQALSDCVRLEPSEAAELYRLLYKVLGNIEESM